MNWTHIFFTVLGSIHAFFLSLFFSFKFLDWNLFKFSFMIHLFPQSSSIEPQGITFKIKAAPLIHLTRFGYNFFCLGHSLMAPWAGKPLWGYTYISCHVLRIILRLKFSLTGGVSFRPPLGFLSYHIAPTGASFYSLWLSFLV